MNGVRLGYSFWGFLADRKVEGGAEVSTPDGNAAYSWSILWEAQRRGWTTYLMQRNRDRELYSLTDGRGMFDAFSPQKRAQAYHGARRTVDVGDPFPELDVLLLEWRFPILGRNCDLAPVDSAAARAVAGTDRSPAYRYDPARHQPDLGRQLSLIEHYAGKIPIVVWDLDHKLTLEEERKMAEWFRLGPAAIFETSFQPREQVWKRTRVEPPTVVADLLQHPTLPADPARKLVYVGSRYERDDVIDEWIDPVAARFPGQVFFYGKWPADSATRWPGIVFKDRIGMGGFRAAYGAAVACPLLAKRSYMKTGFVTPRLWEALLFGTLPIGLASHNEIGRYLDTAMIARDGGDMAHLVRWLSDVETSTRDRWRRRAIERLEFMDARHFVNALERVL